MKTGLFIVTGVILLATSACVSSEKTAQPGNSLSQESGDETCYCNVRKRQQMEARLEKNKQLEEE